MNLLDSISSPEDLRELDERQLAQLAEEIRAFIVSAVSRTGGHLGSNLGVVELTIALHRVFESPRDAILWDTGHQAYVHKILTGRRERFGALRQEGGLSGYPNRAESEHDWIENSHASTVLSYAHGLATAVAHGAPGAQRRPRRVVAVVGDGALTGGMAYEALNNLGHAGVPVVIVLNDNGRSYAPTVSRLASSVSHLRLNPSYVHVRERLRRAVRDLPVMGPFAYHGIHGLTSALRELVEPHVFFEALGVRYTGPLDGHDIGELEVALRNAQAWDGPIVVHILTHKGKGYAPAEEDDVQRLHDVKAAVGTVAVRSTIPVSGDAPVTYTDAFGAAMIDLGARRTELVAITAAMPGPTGLLPFQARYPDRFLDVGIAEQHAVTAAAGMAMGGLRPVVAVYSTFFSRAFDQANLDVGLHGLPVIFALDRAGITGDDGPSHHGVADMVLSLAIPTMTIFAPSSAGEVQVMLETALGLDGPSVIRYPKTPAPVVDPGEVGSGLQARRMREGDGTVCVLAIGKMVAAAAGAVTELATGGIDATLWDVRVVRPADAAMLADAGRHRLVVTVEDGYRLGGAGAFLVDTLRSVVGAQAALDSSGDGSLPGLEFADGEVQARASRRMPATCVLGVPVRYIPQAKADRILAAVGLDAPGIAHSVRLVVERLREGDGVRDVPGANSHGAEQRAASGAGSGEPSNVGSSQIG